MSATAAGPVQGAPRGSVPVGRMFVGVSFDYLVIGGGLSLISLAALALSGELVTTSVASSSLPYLALFANSAHFAASTVRLYTKPGAFTHWPVLTMVLPLVMIGVLGIAIAWPGEIGHHLHALYLTWSPFHYAAQAFGLACMYHYRSGGELSPLDRRLLYATCLLPFLYAFMGAEGIGVDWLLPSAWLGAGSRLRWSLDAVAAALALCVFVAPLGLAARRRLRGDGSLPWICWLIVFSNGVWWVALPLYQAFIWATVFHGLQYLAIVMIFHVRDQRAQPGDTRSPLAHALRFYAASFVLGYLLFNVWPFAYLWAGFGLAESMLLCAAVINIHHFIVDRYIWKLRNDANYTVVTAQA